MKLFRYILILLIAFSSLSCEKELDIVIPTGEDKIVVYGAIENDDYPIVILSWTLDVFGSNDLDAILNSYISGAQVRMFVDNDTIDFIEIKFKNDSLSSFEFPAYVPDPTVLSNLIKAKGVVGKTYGLEVKHQGQTLNASTTIPQLTPLDSIWFEDHPDPAKDSLTALWVKYTDPPEPGNYARYFTKRNSEQFWPFRFTSVFEDEFIDGKSFEFSLARGDDPNSEIDEETFSYFWRGDTVTVKWCAIDKEHFDFWLTLEEDRNGSGSPFGSPVKILTNIEGGLGYWGGYGASEHTAIVPPK